MAKHATVLAHMLQEEIEAIAKQSFALPPDQFAAVVAAAHAALMADTPALVARLNERHAMSIAAIKTAAKTMIGHTAPKPSGSQA